MKSLSHQEDEVIHLMQAVNLLIYLSFSVLLTHKCISRTGFKKQKYEIHLVDTIAQGISFLFHYQDV